MDKVLLTAALLLALLGSCGASSYSQVLGTGAYAASYSKVLLAGGGTLLQNPCSQASVINTTTGGWYCQFVAPNIAATWSHGGPLAGVVIVISFMIATMIFIMGIVLRSDKIRMFGIGEIYEALASLILIGLFFFIAALLFGLLPGIFIGSINPYNASLVQINSTIGSVGNLASNLFYAQMIPAYYSSIELEICGPVPPPPEQETCFSIPNVWSIPLYVFFVLPATAEMILLIDGLLVLNMEFYAILFFMYAAIPVFLIPGILLRAFLPTRSLGGMMVAIAIGFYMIMPLLFGISYTLTSASATSTLNTLAGQISGLSGCTSTGCSGTGSEQNALSQTSPLVTDTSQISSAMGPFWLTVIFFPGLILAMTYGFIVTIAEFIGGMASSGSKMRALI